VSLVRFRAPLPFENTSLRNPELNQFYEYSKQSIFLETDTVEETIREVYTFSS
jgi:hypothetical protein